MDREYVMFWCLVRWLGWWQVDFGSRMHRK
jgi:hypothetical protein